MRKKNVDANEFWEKRELKQSWGKVLLSIFLVCFGLFYGAYCLDMYMGAHNLTFVKFKINPEFGFIVNGNDEVVHYLALNDDARKIFNLNMFKGKKTNEAVSKAVEVAKQNNYLVDENKKIEVTVVSKEETEKTVVEDKILNVIKEKDSTVVAEVVEPTEEDKEIFTDIKLDKIEEVEETVKKKEEEKKICNYTKVSYEDMSGDNRTLTAINTSIRMYPKGSKNVVLVNSNDMLQGSISNSLASVLDAPILFIDVNSIKEEVLNELTRLNVENVYILGGVGSISDNVIKIIKDNYGIDAQRVFGADRYITSIEIAKKVDEHKTITSVIVASGENEPVDAAMISAISGAKNMPILYTKKDSLVPSVKDYIKSNKNINTIYVSGGLITKNVISELESLGRGVEVISGKDRYITNANVLNKFQTKFRSVVLVNNMVDVVIASRFASDNGSALFYIKDNLSDEHIKLVKSNSSINKLYYFGGESIKVGFRNSLFNIKKSNMSKCENITEELLFQNKKVVFYVPHQDDESSYFGQTIGAAVKKLGAENVHLVVMTKGNSSDVYIRDNKIPAEKDTSLEENKGKITYLDEPVNNDMLKSYGYVDNNGNASFMMARDAEFRNSMKALGIPKNNYVFAEELVGKNGTTHIDRFDDKSLSKNTEHVKNIMKYYDNLYNHDVTHITYTFLDAHTDHNTLGRCLNELYFDTTLDDKSFENVYSIVKFTENHVIDSRYLITLKNKENFESQLNSFKAYEMDESNKILGIGYRSADHIFNTFVERIKNNTLETTIHIPFKK